LASLHPGAFLSNLGFLKEFFFKVIVTKGLIAVQSSEGRKGYLYVIGTVLALQVLYNIHYAVVEG
jgi:hypothetical protein